MKRNLSHVTHQTKEYNMFEFDGSVLDTTPIGKSVDLAMAVAAVLGLFRSSCR